MEEPHFLLAVMVLNIFVQKYRTVQKCSSVSSTTCNTFSHLFCIADDNTRCCRKLATEAHRLCQEERHGEEVSAVPPPFLRTLRTMFSSRMQLKQKTSAADLLRVMPCEQLRGATIVVNIVLPGRFLPVSRAAWCHCSVATLLDKAG